MVAPDLALADLPGMYTLTNKPLLNRGTAGLPRLCLSLRKYLPTKPLFSGGLFTVFFSVFAHARAHVLALTQAKAMGKNN